MHAIGNVLVSQGMAREMVNARDLESGFIWHEKAHRHYLSTIGEDHHRTADVSHRLADDYMKAVTFCNKDKAKAYPSAQ